MASKNSYKEFDNEKNSCDQFVLPFETYRQQELMKSIIIFLISTPQPIFFPIDRTVYLTPFIKFICTKALPRQAEAVLDGTKDIPWFDTCLSLIHTGGGAGFLPPQKGSFQHFDNFLLNVHARIDRGGNIQSQLIIINRLALNARQTIAYDQL